MLAYIWKETIIVRKKNKAFKSVKNSITTAFIVEVVFWLAVIGALMIKCFYFQFTTRLNSRPFLTLNNAYTMMGTFGTLLIIVSIFILAFNKKRRIALLIFDVFLSLLIFADTIYYRYYYSAITIPVLYQIRLVGSVGDSIISLIKIKDLVYFADFPFLAVILYALRRTGKDKMSLFKLKYRAITALLVFAVGLTVFKIAYNNVDTSIFPYDNNYVARYLGIKYFHYYDIKRFVKENLLTNRTLSSKERATIDEFFKNKPKSSDKHRGIAKGKNLILVQVEALQHFVINRKTDKGEEITPNLNKLIKESAYFDNFYYQIGGGNTADAELLVNASLYPAKEGCAYFRFPNNTYHSLGNILKQQGYGTYVFHANNPTFWNRNVAYKALGFDTFVSNNDYVLDEYIGWGLGDASFFRQSLDRIDTSKPFYGFFITLSSHFPFKYEFFETYDFDVGKYEGQFLGYYLKAINYADYALGRFIEELKERGLYEDTLLVIYGDHMAVPKDYSEQLMEFLGVEYSDFNWAKLQRVPCLIHYPGLENGKVFTVTGGEIDILPTVANLMGFDAPYAIGKDLFNTEYGYAVLRNSSVVTDKYIYLSGLRTAFDINTGKELQPEEYEKEVSALQRELFISDLIIQKNGLKR
ncbi:MAG TPA: LTA synthase family protein [Clostridiaceae bacterium]|nr:LTA synthase family protein [Clostridiaceae bacterium]